MLTHHDEIESFKTKDGSFIKELMHPAQHQNNNQSLAEAIVPAGTSTALHKHHTSEELYHITHGKGLMTLGQQRFEVKTGDTVCIHPDTAHCIENTGQEDLHILCCCSPPYSHDDTELL